MASIIEKYDEEMEKHPDRRAMQTIPGQGRYRREDVNDDPNWRFYTDQRGIGAALQLEDHSGLDLQRIIKAMWYYRGMFMTIALFLATIFVAANHVLMPDKYEATARVRVKMPVIIDDSPRARQTVSIIPTEVLSNKVLTKVIEDLDMTKRTTPEIIPELLGKLGIEAKNTVEDGTGIMRWLRSEIKIHQERQGMQTAVFSVSLTSKKPEVAAEIVNAIVATYMDLRHTFESADASEAVAFLTPKVKAAKAAVEEANTRLSKFKLDNSAFLIPSTMIEENIVRLEEEYAASESRLAQLTELNVGLKKLVKAEPRYVASGAIATDAPSASAAQLATLRQRYTLAQARYVAGHPYLAQLRADIKALERAVAKTPRSNNRGAGQVTNPEWLRMTQEITANEAEVRVLNSRLPVILRQVDNLSAHLSHATSAQAALLTHQSAWDQAYNHYNTINGRLLNAQTQAEAQNSDVGRELSILDNATVPTLPITASRTTLQFLGVVGGFAIAFVVILFYTRIKNWEIPTEGRQVGVVSTIALNLLGFAWLFALLGYIAVNPYL